MIAVTLLTLRDINLLVCAAVLGLISAVGVGGLLWGWESKRPMFQGKPDGEKQLAEYCKRAMCCAWLVSAVLYIILTYWWSGSN